ncbi:MAG: phage tail family protein [Lachnospiraceae bacterium]|nr:phage tail family protein [Lachnospiraceae bacterium]
MAVAPTGAIYKALEFDNVSSRTYGVYITGEAVYNAPKRDVEMITIPGRSGSFALDNGRFENIEVSYPAGIFADTEADFRQAISDFRNFLCSRVGYVRLTDEYNPDEYRMAVYKSGLDVDPAQLRAGEFKLVFDCKPQRWLTSGETAVTVTSGDTLTNPTLFESGPLLEVGGSGSIQFNGYEIEFAGIPYGEVVIADHMSYGSSNNPYTKTVTLDTSLLNTGDPIYPETKDCEIQATLKTSGSGYFRSVGLRNTPTNVLDTSTGISSNKKEAYLYMWPDFGEGFVYGTAKTLTCSAEYRYSVTSLVAYFEKVDVTIAYDGDDSVTVTISRSGTLEANTTRYRSRLNFPTMYGDSSKPNAAPIFIDCDLGEAYIVENGVYRSLNQYIDLGSELPKLASGSNTVTFDNTITQLKITPRWWKV